MADILPASVDVRQHPHPDSTVSMPVSVASDTYDASAHPTPFLMAGFNPQAKLRKSYQSAPAANTSTSIVNNTGEQLTVTVTKQPPNKLAAAQLAPVSVLFVPPSIEPNSANAPEPVQTRPRARSSHEAHSPRAAAVPQQMRSPRNAKPRPAAAVQTAALGPLPPKHQPSPAHLDAATFDFFSGATAPPAAAKQQPVMYPAKVTVVSSTASTATSTPVQSVRRVEVETSEEEEEEDEEEEEEETVTSDDERERRERKKERKAARRAKKEAKKAKKAAKHKKAEKKDLEALPPTQREKLKQTSKWLAQVDYYWINHNVDMVTSTGFGIKKRHVTWRFVLDGRLHEMELFHSRFSGKRRIRLDSVELVNEKVLFDGGSSHEIFIGERMLEVVIYISEVGDLISTHKAHNTWYSSSSPCSALTVSLSVFWLPRRNPSPSATSC